MFQLAPITISTHLGMQHLCNALRGLQGEAVKKICVYEWHKQFKESLHVEITNEDNAHHFL
jgi:hypothetical protein